MITSDVENFPGFKEGIQGPDLMHEMKKQAERFGTKIIDKNVTGVDFSKKIAKIYVGQTEYQSYTVIIATGASAKWLGIDSETKLLGKGISSCATCDGYFFKEKDIIVVGGGDSAMEEALFLTKFVKSIKIIVRKDKVRASAIMAKRADKSPKIEFLYNLEVKEFIGENSVEGVKILNNKTNKESELKIQGAFIAIGHKPNTELFKNQLEMDKHGYIIRKSFSHTSVPNVFVAGDVHDTRYRQAITAAAYGCEAALDAMRYLEENGVEVDVSANSYGQA